MASICGQQLALGRQVLLEDATGSPAEYSRLSSAAPVSPCLPSAFVSHPGAHSFQPTYKQSILKIESILRIHISWIAVLRTGPGRLLLVIVSRIRIS